MNEFDGTVSIVTGGASGIGLATARALAAAGSTVAVLDLTVDGLPEELTGFVADVSDRSSVDAAVAAVGERFGRIDILVNNAGISAVGTVEENDDAEWMRVLNINVIGMARVSAAALPWLRTSPCASIVNLCSIGALNGLPQRAIYNASKGAVLSLTYAMATDHVREGIRVNCVSPGTVSTPFVDRMLAKFEDPVAERAALDARQATGRMVTPEEVAGAILYLASPLSASTTGTALEVDGGVHNLRVRPQPVAGGAEMIRLASVIGLPAENAAEYERLHANVWPRVLERLRASQMTNYSIFRYGELLFSYLEYTGDDLDADNAAIAADEATKEWWAVCEPLQRPLPGRAPGEWWQSILEVFHLD